MINSLPPPSFNGFRTDGRKVHDHEMNWGDSALTAPTSPDRRIPKIDKSKVDPQIVKAAEGMEAMFIDYMMKVMRQTIPKNEMDLESPATQIYRSMQDTEYAQKAAHHGGVGLADQIIAYMAAQQYNLPRGSHQGMVNPNTPTATAQAPHAASTGGTHEGQSTE